MYFFLNKRTPFKNEKDFTLRYGKQIRLNGGFRHKISDMDTGYKPADAIVAYKGKTYLIEFKVGNEKNKTDIIKKLRPNQYVGLTKRYENGGIALIIYYNKYYNKYWLIEFHGEKTIILDLKNTKPVEN